MTIVTLNGRSAFRQIFERSSRLLTLLALAAGCAKPTQEQPVRRQSEALSLAGLVAAYGFEEGSGTRFGDGSGNGNVGEISGASWVTSGKYGKALSFDGVDDWATIADAESLQPSQAFTLEAWVRPTSLAAQAAVVAKETTQASVYALYARGSSGNPAALIEGSTSAEGSSSLPTNTWSHLAATWDGETLELFINGDLQSSTPFDDGLFADGLPLRLGGHQLFDHWFAGLIDEVLIFDHARSETQIESDMNAPIGGPLSGPVAAFGFEEGTGTTVADATGHGHSGTISGATWESSGKYGNALSFDGIDDLVTIADAAALDFTTQMTISAWVKIISMDGWALVVAKEDTSNVAYSLFSSNEGDQPGGYFVSNETYVQAWGGGPISLDSWHHIATTYDGANLRSYINGKLVTSTATTASIDVTSGPLLIGGSTVTGEAVHGLIDEVRVYDRALSAREIGLDASTPVTAPNVPRLVAEYGFEENTGTAVADTSGIDNTGTVAGASWTTAGKYGNALTYDGVDDWVTVGHDPSLDMRHTLTAMAWVKPATLGNDWQTIILKEYESEGLSYSLYANDFGETPPAGYIRQDGFDLGVKSASALPVDAWTHLAFTYDCSVMSVYVNGRLVGSRAQGGSVGRSDAPLRIGGNAIWGEFFEGTIDEVRLYDGALTEAQIRTAMATAIGSGGGCGGGCDDGNVCNGTETCVANVCQPGTPLTVDDGNPCTTDSCHPVNGVTHTPVATGTSCANATVCDGAETCDASGVCVAGTPPVIDDANPCTTDACDPVIGVTHTPVAVGTSCANGTICDGAETCNASGVCVAGTPPSLSDGNPCTTDACDPVAGVTHTPVATGTSCSDPDLCNGEETCSATAVCTPGTPVSTDDGNACTIGSCDPLTGVVTHNPVPTGTECFPDICSTGECNAGGECIVVASLPPDDGDSCTLEWCDPVLGPQVTSCSPLDRTVPTTLYDSMKWLYSGTNPIQIGVEPGTIIAHRATAFRGLVRARDGSPLSGVRVSILDRPELGYTTSQANGYYDLVVNGGGSLVVVLEKEGYFASHRSVETTWGEHAVIPTVVLVAADPVATVIDLSAPSGLQVARGSVQTDTDGTRQGTLLVPAGTEATMQLPNGQTEELSSMTVRLTEYTVGESGFDAMPGPLPKESLYTYAFEASIDEAIEAGAVNVSFSEPLPYYLENFLQFSAGTSIPLGYFDREASAWKGAESGVVLEVVSESAGLAQLDVTGDGIEDSAAALAGFGITEIERQKLAELYDPGQSLWRVQLSHFTPWDCNMGGAPPEADPPNNPPPDDDDDTSCDDEVPLASTILCQSQTLLESVPLAGTPYTLNYSSARVPGRTAAFEVKIPLSGNDLPGVVAILLEVTVGGRQFYEAFPALPNQTKTFVWDGLDAFGRKLQGAQVLRATVAYTSNTFYEDACCFAYAGNGIALGISRTPSLAKQQYRAIIGQFDASAEGLGGWSLDAQHFHERTAQTLQLGNGKEVSSNVLPPVINVLATGGPSLADAVAVAPDGTVFSGGAGAVLRLTPDGTPTLFSGTPGQTGYAGDGLPASDPSVRFSGVRDIVIDRDGALYIADSATLGSDLVRRIRADGIIETFAGVPGVHDVTPPEGAPATQTPIADPRHLAMAPDGTLFISVSRNVLRVAPDGTVNRVVGALVSGNAPPEQVPDDGERATDVYLRPHDIALAPDGTLYAIISDCSDDVAPVCSNEGAIVKIEHGRVYHVAGEHCFDSNCPYPFDGTPAKTAPLNPAAIEFDASGRLYFIDGRLVRTIASDGSVRTVVGRVGGGPMEEGAAARSVLLNSSDIAFGPDGLYTGNKGTTSAILRVAPALPSSSGSSFFIGDPSGDAFHGFDTIGRHLVTQSSLTGANLRSLAYNAAGHLSSISDESGLVTTIERDSNGKPTAIIAPFGQRTELTLDSNGYFASVTDPKQQTTFFTHDSTGLLRSVTNPRNQTSTMDYDSKGRLIFDQDPAGGSHALERISEPDSTEWTVSRTTALGRTTTYATTKPELGEERRVVTDASGNETSITRGTDLVAEVQQADGTVVISSRLPDARFGVSAPLTSTSTVTPSGLTRTETRSRTYGALNSENLLDFATRTETTDVNGRDWTTVFTKATRTFTTTSPVGRVTTRTIDEKGRMTQTQVAGLAAVDFTYNAHGQLETTNQGGGRVRTSSYFSSGEQAGYLQSVTDALGVATVFARDALGHVATETRASTTTAFSWDATGNLQMVIPPGKPGHNLAYSPVNFLQSYSPPAAGLPFAVTSYAYDLDRMLRNETRPTGQQIVRTPDSGGRVDTVAIPGGLIDYEYYPPATPSGAGKVSDIFGPYGVHVAFTYDGFLTTSTEWSGDVTGAVAWQYNTDFQKLLESVSGATGTSSTAFGYDNDQLLTCASPTTCTPAGSDALTLTRSLQHGLVTGITLGSTSETLTYNTFGELASQNARYSGTSFANLTYHVEGSATAARDALGRIRRKTEVIGGSTKVHDYVYDDLGRLTDVTIDGVLNEHFGYDGNGNRTTHYSAATGLTATPTYDDQDRLLTYGDWVFTYTANGELETKTNTATSDEWIFGYDVLGNLLSVGLPNGTLIEYLVDAVGRRVGKKINGVLAKQWLYRDALKPVAELDGSGALVAQFVHASKSNVPDYVQRGGMTYRVVSDHLGSPRYVVNVANVSDVPFTASYSAFGSVTGAGLDWMPFGFAGGIHDQDTGLVRFGARDYDPMVGRWTSKDPIRFDTVDGPNFYTYAKGDPVNFRDGTGRSATGAALPIAGGAAAADGPLPIGDAIAIGILACAIIYDAVTDTPEERCYSSYLSDTAYCGETYPDDHRYNICMDNAWKRYIRCLNGLPPGGPLVPR